MSQTISQGDWEQALRMLIGSGWMILAENRQTGKVTVCLPPTHS